MSPPGGTASPSRWSTRSRLPCRCCPPSSAPGPSTAEPMGARTLPEDEQAIVEAVAHWVDREVRPQAGRLERAQADPDALMGEMKERGVVGLAVPARWSASAVSTRCFARVTEHLARGWMSLAGAMG